MGAALPSLSLSHGELLPAQRRAYGCVKWVPAASDGGGKGADLPSCNWKWAGSHIGWEKEQEAQVHTPRSLPWPWWSQGHVCLAAVRGRESAALMAPLSNVYCVIFPL